MSEYTVLQVADTRFAVRCNYPAFKEWLSETFGGFISRGDFQLRIDLTLASISETKSSGHSLSVTPVGRPYEHGELNFRLDCAEPAYFFLLILQICLRCAMATKQAPDLLLHSSGIIHEGIAYIFTGESGSGKSTICKLLAQDPAFIALHDEVVAVSRKETGFYAWSTPLRGEMMTGCNRGAPLKYIFFLKQSRANYTVRLQPRKVAEMLCFNLIPPFLVKDGHLAAEHAASLKQLLALAEYVPGYTLYFRPERSFWDCIPKPDTKLEEKELWTAVTR